MSTVAAGLGRASSRRTTLVLAALLAASALGWAATVRGEGMEEKMMVTPGAVGIFLGGWVAMMAAMMLPSAVPFVLLYSAGAKRGLATALLVVAYLAVWASFGVLAYAAQVWLDRLGMGDTRAYVVAATLVAAGIYQLTPLKSACLRRCRNPVSFLMEHWRGGRLGAARLGADHGLYCLGCCWALMAVLVVAGAMGLVWVAAIALAVLVEKLVPHGERIAALVGIALVALGVAVAANPEIAMTLTM